MSTAADKKLLVAIQTGTLSKKIFKVNEYNSVFYKFIQGNPNFSKMLKECGGDTIEILGRLDEGYKVGLLRHLAANKFLEVQPAFHGIIPHFYKPDIAVVKCLDKLEQTNETAFQVDIPIDVLSTFMGFQYLKIKFKAPKLAARFQAQYGATAKFRYTDKPGIRLFHEMEFSSNTVPVQRYDYLDVLRYDKEQVLDNFHVQWNKLIGHDLHEMADVYNPINDVTYGVPVKTGYQTPKPLSKHEALELLVPLHFDHNQCFRNKFNLNSFLEGTLTISGKLAKSVNMVMAEYYPTDLELPVVPLECQPLEIECFELISEKMYVDDVYHALLSAKQLSKFVRYPGNKIGTIKDRDPEEQIPVNGKGYVEAITFYLRPASYENHFHNWQRLSEVSHQCSPTPIVVKNGQGLPKAISIKPAEIAKPVYSLEEIGLYQDADLIKPDFDPRYYSTVESFKNGRQFCNYYPRDDVGYKFNFNYHLNQELLSGMFVQSKLDNVRIHYKFKPEYIGSDGLLTDNWQYIIYRDLCNQQYGRESSLSTLYLL